MENNIPVQNVQPGNQHPIYQQPVKASYASKGLVIFLLVFSILMFFGLLFTAAFAVYNAYQTKKDISAIANIEYTLTNKSSEVAKSINILSTQGNQLWIADCMCDTGITDNFITENVLFCVKDVVVYDLEVQPDFDSNYTGKGKFKIADSELKGDVEEMIQQFKSIYEDNKTSSMVAFDSLEIHVTVKNYSIGIYKNGQFTLKGE
jgi:hypothetical protein